METPDQTAPVVDDAEAASMAAQEHHRGALEAIREAWSQALVAVSATEEEVQKILARLTTWVEVGPEEARRLGVELTERLRSERIQLEEGVESAVTKALTPFRLPSRDDLTTLGARVEALEARVDRLLLRRTGT
jgi:polyhydroxyalkanoate synthesis regulator phasin